MKPLDRVRSLLDRFPADDVAGAVVIVQLADGSYEMAISCGREITDVLRDVADRLDGVSPVSGAKVKLTKVRDN